MAPDCTYFVNLHDVGVLQPRHGLGFDPKAGQFLGTAVAAGPNHLQCHRPLQGQVPGPVDDPHAATAEHALDV